MDTSETKTINAKAAPDSESAKATSQTKAKKKSSFAIGEKTANILCWVVCLLFSAFAAYILIERNSDTLYQAQNFSFFNSTSAFFNDCMAKPGGLVSWIASFLTQFLYEPVVGSSIYIALWCAIFYVAKKALNVSSIWAGMLILPSAALLLSTVDNGYWLYYVKQQGFWFYGTVGFLICMLMTWLAQISKNSIYRLVLVIVVALTYRFFGWYSFLAAAYISIIHLFAPKNDKLSILNRLLPAVAAVVCVAAIPFVSYNFFSNIRLEDMWLIGCPFFETPYLTSIHPQIPFIVLAIMPVVLTLLPKTKNVTGAKATLVCLLNLATVYGSMHTIEALDFQDYNYHAEIRMYQAIEEQDWDKALEQMSGMPCDANRQMVLLKNIALMNKGEMGFKMFKYNNMGNNPDNHFDTLHVQMSRTAAPLIYMNHGKTNFSIRYCITNSEIYGTSFNHLKTLAFCSLVQNEMDVARKYLTLLQNTIYYREWADKYMPIVDNPALITNYHEFDNIRELRDHMGSTLDGDAGSCEMYLLTYFANTTYKDSKYLQELCLNYSMIYKDENLFWKQFWNYFYLHQGDIFANTPYKDSKYLQELCLNYSMIYKDENLFWKQFWNYFYLHQGDIIPIHYQEAAYMYGNLDPNVDISNLPPFDQELVVKRYAGFQQMSQSLLATGMKTEDVGKAMRSSYGDTFYWFYFFCRGIHSY